MGIIFSLPGAVRYLIQTWLPGNATTASTITNLLDSSTTGQIFGFSFNPMVNGPMYRNIAALYRIHQYRLDYIHNNVCTLMTFITTRKQNIVVTSIRSNALIANRDTPI